MDFPLNLRLKRTLHKDIAALQDYVVEAVYSVQEDVVLHGGTAIWRCFNGKRFSEDLDFYFKPKANFKGSIEKELSKFGVKTQKFRSTANAIYSRFEKDRTAVELEVSLRAFKNPVVSSYEKSDGTTIDIFTPSAEELLVEKLTAFKNRKLVRDIYDVFYLSGFVSVDKTFSKNIAKLLLDLPRPIDEQNLKNLVLSGAVPSFEQMAGVLNRRFLK